MSEIRLRAIEAPDLEILQQWRNSKNVMPNCRQYRPLSMKDMGNWYIKKESEQNYNLTNDLFIILLEDAPLGAGGYVRIDWRNRKAEVSFYVGEIEKCTEEIISKALLRIVEYADKTLNLHKIYFPVYETNPYLPIYEKILKREYVAKKEYFWEGKYLDRIVLVKYFDRK